MGADRSDEQPEVVYAQSGTTTPHLLPLLIGLFSASVVGLVFNFDLPEFFWSLPGISILIVTGGISSIIVARIHLRSEERHRLELWSSSGSQQRSSNTESPSSPPKEDNQK
jgi:hypothetical protein